MESLYAIKKSSLRVLSIQYLFDCDISSWGCGAFFIESTFQWIISTGAHLMNDRDYPYRGYKGDYKVDPSKNVDTQWLEFIE